MIVNYYLKTFIVQATGQSLRWITFNQFFICNVDIEWLYVESKQTGLLFWIANVAALTAAATTMRATALTT